MSRLQAARAPRASRRAHIAVAAPASVLLALGVAYYLTYEPAPEIGIAWRLGITTDERRAHERRFRLVNREVVQGRMRYDLLDPRKENIEALVAEPDVEDTDGIDRDTVDLPLEYRYGESWMWVADRVPVLRTPGVVTSIIVTCVVVLAVGLGVVAREGRRRGGT